MVSKFYNLPVVAICGKPNVGKSTLFNRISGRMHAIILDEPGITRDRCETVVNFKDKKFLLSDTGGIIDKCRDSITQKVIQQVKKALEEADLILMLVDAQEGLTALDLEVRDFLIKLNKPIILVANKVDDEKHKNNLADLYTLGLGHPLPVSSIHNRGIEELLELVYKLLPEQEYTENTFESLINEATKVAIVGKPNVGKSSLVNFLLEDERVIVDETPGTTRDAIDIPFTLNGKQYLLIDTAGMRRKAHIKKSVEFYSVHRTLKAIRRSDIALILIESTEGITDQDKKIIGYAVEQGVGIVIAFSKWDLVEKDKESYDRLKKQLAREIPHLDYVPVTKISVVGKQRKLLSVLFKFIDTVQEATLLRIPTSEFNEFLSEIKSIHPPPTKGGKQAKIYYGAQVSVKPTKFLLSVNQKKLFHFSYIRFLENSIRKKYTFTGVPIIIDLKED
ncbi:MAG: ribosome biogenesis GTPase Der [Candidatus Hydrogenedentes bacterium]|nr:ribosome biogenesis GTPase Der [Candidatus Hydrogenedentota bacterium]